MLREQEDNEDISFKEGLFFPFRMLRTHWRDFVLLSAMVSIFMSVVVLLTGQCFFCFFSQEVSSYIFCSNSWINAISSYALLFCSLAFFINRCQLIFVEKQSFTDVIKVKISKKDGKALLVVFLYFLLWLVIGIGGVFLHMRQPNPDWTIELCFFVFMSVVMVFSVVLLFNFVIFQHFLQGGPFFALNKTFWGVLDNIYSYIAWFLLYVVIFTYLFQFAIQIIFYSGVPLLLRVFFAEFCIYFLIYTLAALIVAQLTYQEKIFFRDEK